MSVGAVGKLFVARVPAILLTLGDTTRFATIVYTKRNGLYRRGNPTNLTGGNAVVNHRFCRRVQRRGIGCGRAKLARCTLSCVGAPPITRGATRAIYARILGI